MPHCFFTLPVGLMLQFPATGCKDRILHPEEDGPCPWKHLTRNLPRVSTLQFAYISWLMPSKLETVFPGKEAYTKDR